MPPGGKAGLEPAVSGVLDPWKGFWVNCQAGPQVSGHPRRHLPTSGEGRFGLNMGGLSKYFVWNQMAGDHSLEKGSHQIWR